MNCADYLVSGEKQKKEVKGNEFNALAVISNCEHVFFSFETSMSVHLQMAAVNTPVSIPSSRFTVSAGKDTLLGQIKQLVKVKLLCICQFLMQYLHNFAVSKLLGPIHVNFVLIGSLSNSDGYGYENVT